MRLSRRFSDAVHSSRDFTARYLTSRRRRAGCRRDILQDAAPLLKRDQCGDEWNEERRTKNEERRTKNLEFWVIIDGFF